MFTLGFSWVAFVILRFILSTLSLLRIFSWKMLNYVKWLLFISWNDCVFKYFILLLCCITLIDFHKAKQLSLDMVCDPLRTCYWNQFASLWRIFAYIIQVFGLSFSFCVCCLCFCIRIMASWIWKWFLLFDFLEAFGKDWY